jgi:hypothetical protein
VPSRSLTAFALNDGPVEQSDFSQCPRASTIFNSSVPTIQALASYTDSRYSLMWLTIVGRVLGIADERGREISREINCLGYVPIQVVNGLAC